MDSQVSKIFNFKLKIMIFEIRLGLYFAADAFCCERRINLMAIKHKTLQAAPAALVPAFAPLLK